MRARSIYFQSSVQVRTFCQHKKLDHRAAQRGFTEIVKFLAEHGADLEMKDANGWTPLELAKGVGVPGVRQAAGEGHPETAALIEKLMAAKASR